MIKQSKTTIKELTAQYRAVLKHAFFAGIAAVALSTTDAMAEINVAPGETDITSGVINAINTSINNNAPDKSKFSYTAPDGTTTIKLSDDTQYEAADYKTDSTSKANTYGITGPTSVNWESNLTAANYTYTPLTADGTAGTPVTGDTAVNHLTKTVETSALHSLYSGTSLALSSDSTATATLNVLDYSTTSGGNSYYLYKTAEEEFKLVTDKTNPTTTIVTDPSAIGVSGVLNDLTEAYKGDAEKVANIQKTLNDSYKTNTDSYDYINNTNTGYLAKDKASAAALKINKESLDTANSGFNTAQTNYNGSVGQAIDGHILNEDGAVAKLFNEKEANMSEQLGYNIANNPANPDAEGSLVNALTMNEGKTEGKVTSVVGAINANTDAIAKVYSDAEDLIALKEANMSEQLGYNIANKPTNKDASGSLVNALTMNKNAEGETVGTVSSVVGAINTNTDAIAKRTVSLDETEEGLEFATITDGTNSANVYTKEAAEAIFAEKQQWVDKTLGIESKNADAVKTALTGTIAGEESTMTGAINALDTAIADEATRAMEEEAAIRSEFAAADALTLSSAQAFANAGDAFTLSKANAYTDAKVDTLEKNVSGGIAAATALSAVEVSNVKRGEMSVGGGYGYYNGQSAGAFGMAMGLSDNWSVNAGAGIASGDKTQVSFRAGTNYKFKLF